jgi:hypothetical protein
MPFALRITKSRPNLARVIATTDPTPISAASPLVFWRGAALGFASAMVVFDFFFLNGTTLARLVYAVRYAVWFVAHGIHG